MAVHRAKQRAADGVPVELRERRRWIRRSASKVPLRVRGGVASSTDSSTWSTFAEARASRVGVGLGYVLADSDGIVCLDLDHCVGPDGTVAEWARDILAACPPTYIELSPSGTGLHVWGRADVGTGRVIRDGDRAIEVYGQGRYIAMGARWNRAPSRLGDLSNVVAGL